MLSTGLVEFLLTQTAVTSLIAQGNAIQPIPSPPELTDTAGNPLFPCVTYQTASDVPQYNLNGADGVTNARVVFDCLAPQNPGGYLVSKSIALAVKAALSGYQGTLPDGTRVFFAQVVNVTDNFEVDALLSRCSVHVLVTYSG